MFSPEVLMCVREYIANNPVKAGLVQSPAEYEYSFACLRYELDDVPQGLRPSRYLDLVGTSKDVP